MDIAKYAVLLKIVETGSLTKAANELGYTQSGVTHIINNIESELQVKLLVRSRSGVYPTAAGQELIPYIRALYEKNVLLCEKAEEVRNTDLNAIHLGTITSITTHYLPQLILKFNEIRPDAEFKLLTGDYSEIENWVQTGKVDMGFTLSPTQMPFDVFPVLKSKLLLLLPEGHPLAEYDRVPQQLLLNYPYIFYSTGMDRSSLEFKDVTVIEELKKNAKYILQDDHGIMSMVENGLGISILPELVMCRTPFHIVMRELDPPAHREIVLATKQGRELSPTTKQFYNYVIESAKRENT